MAIAKLLEDSLEDNVLTLICWDYDWAPKMALQVTADLFSTREYQRIAKFALDHLTKYGVPPRDHLRDYMEKEIARRDGTFLRDIINAMDALHSRIQGRFVQDDLDLFIARRKMLMSLDKAYDLLEQNDLDAARDALYTASAIHKPPQGVWLHDTEKWLAFLKQREGIEFSSGIDILDERGVHPNRGELYLHMGPRKSGKTWALIQIGRRAVEARHDVLHITLENSTAITQQRYTQAFLQLTAEEQKQPRVPLFAQRPSGRFQLTWQERQDQEAILAETITTMAALRDKQELYELLPDDEKETENPLKNYQFSARPGSPGRLLVQEFPTGTLSVAQLNNFLDHLERTENFKPDIIILDYLNLMEIGDVRQHRLSLGRAGIALRGLAVQRKLALVTATQTNRQSASAKVVTGTHIAEDWSLLGTADTAVAYAQSAMERSINIARVYVDACRNAKDKWIAQIVQSYGTGQFCIDSVYMDKQVEDETARFGEEEGEDGGM